jgi:hypothetical protein
MTLVDGRVVAAAVLALACNGAAALPPAGFTDVTPPERSPIASVGMVAVHPLDGDRIIVTTESGLRTSGDGGRSWSGPVLLGTIERLFAHKGHPGVVFAQTRASRLYHAFVDPPVTYVPGQTYRSSDFGATWTLVYEGLDEVGGYAVSPFASDPADPAHLFATRRSPLFCGLHCYFATDPADVSMFESRDGGGTWRTAAYGLPPPPPMAALGRNATLGADGPTRGAPTRLFLTGTDRTYFSDDAAATWKVFGTQGIGQIGWVRQDVSQAETLYAWEKPPQPVTTSRSTIFRSDDSGVTWRSIFVVDNPVLGGPPAMELDPARPGRIWLWGLESGVFLSEDRGESWRNVGFAADYVYYNPGSPYGSYQVARDVAPMTTGSGDVYVVHLGHLYRGSVASREPIAIEYQYGDRFWITGDPAEAVSQDYRANEARRTGRRFGLWGAATRHAGAVAICRFQGRRDYGQDSRFIAVEGSECDTVKASPAFVLEGEGEYFAVAPTAQGGCAEGLIAVRRFNNLASNVNHRYVADAPTAAEMRAAGWYDEGVRLCARPLAPGE